MPLGVLRRLFTNNGPLTISPVGPEITVTPDSETPFAVQGGDGSYTWAIQGGDVDDPSGANVTYKAPSLPGVYHVTVSDGSGASASVTVKSGVAFRVTPHCARIQRGATAEFQVVSGNSPYLWEAEFGTLSATSGEKVAFTPEATLGLYTLRAYDSAGAVVDLCVEVIGDGPVIQPSSATVIISTDKLFKVISGIAPYTWTADRGTVSDGKYTAPGSVGSDTVTVTDSMGKTDTATVNVIKGGCSVSPNQAIVGINGNQSFTVNDCVSPYTWTTERGTVSSEGNYTAPGIAGSYTMTVTDATGAKATATIEVGSCEGRYVVSPTQATVVINASKLFTVSCGVAPYTWTVERGTVSPDGNYTAPGSIGSDTVTVTDGAGAKATVTIDVIKDGIGINPSSAIVKINTNQSFTVVDGVSPYTWTSERGTVSDGKYTAPGSIGSDTVTVTDATGAKVTATIDVIIGDIAIQPSSAKVEINANKLFTVVGGVAPHSWNAERGTISSDGSYTAPGTVGSDTVTVTDATGAKVAATIEVTKKVLKINPSITAVNAGDQTTFTAIGGDGNYTWSTGKGSLSDNKGTTVTYTAPTLAGDDTVTLTDGSGDEAKATMRVLPAVKELNITPAIAKLSAGDNQKFVIHNAIGDISWTASGGNIASDGTYTAPASISTYTIVATDLTSSRRVEATVTVGTSLTVTPTEKNMHTGDSANFSVSGGEAPYSWRVIGDGLVGSDTSEAGEEVRFTAGVTTGKVTLVVADNKSSSREAIITVVGEMLITPENTILPRGGSETFQVSGGTGDITWITDYGNVDNAGNYTAPEGIGTYVVTASDTAGNKASANIEVSDVVPVITPAKAWLQRGGKTTFKVVGGTPPYRWEASIGSIPRNGDTVTYQAPKLSSDVTIKLIDNLGNESKASVYVDLPLLASRQEIFVRPEQTKRVSVVGGIPAFDWQTGKGEMSTPRTEELGTNSYTAPDIFGDDIITIRDQKGDTTTVAVHVIPPLLVTPHQRFMEREKTKQFTVVSGVSPYTAVVTGEGNIDPVKSDDGHFKFTSESVADKDIVIEFRDSVANDERVVKVHVYVERNLLVSPREMLHVPFGNEKPFKAIGGTGDFFVVADRGYAEIDPETGVGSYTAPDVIGESNLTIVDSSDQEIVIKTIIGYSEPFVSPSIATLVPGETKSFMVSRGAPKYEWGFEGGTWQGMDNQNSVVQITAPPTAGIYNLSVKDGKLSEALATITVIQPLIVSPVSYPVFRGEKVKVRFEKRGGAGACDWVLIDLQEVEKGDDYIVVRPRTDIELGKKYLISCHDQNGEVAQSEIVVGNLPIDLNADGIISEEEILICIDKFFKGERLNGVNMDRQQLFLHVEAFLLMR
jgi:hypothetical protein